MRNTETTTTARAERIVSAMNSALRQPEATEPMETLTKVIAHCTSIDGAMSSLYRAAETEVVTGRWQIVKMLVEDREFEPVEALRVVVHETTRDIVGRGADDSWSGRTNDLKRVRFDALRRWVQNTEFLLPSAS